MPINWRLGRARHGNAKRRALRVSLPALVALVLLVSFRVVSAVPITSGTSPTVGNILNQGAGGVTSYNVYYSYPSVAQVGTTLTIDLSLHLNQFSGEVEFIAAYSMKAELYVGTNLLEQTVLGPSQTNPFSFLYPGSTWGPEGFNFSLTEANTGVAPGTSANATLAVVIEDSPYYGYPGNIFGTEPPMTAAVGSLIIENVAANNATSTSTTTQSGGPTLLPYILVASGVVMLITAVFIPRALGRQRRPRNDLATKPRQSGPESTLGLETHNEPHPHEARKQDCPGN